MALLLYMRPLLWMPFLALAWALGFSAAVPLSPPRERSRVVAEIWAYRLEGCYHFFLGGDEMLPVRVSLGLSFEPDGLALRFKYDLSYHAFDRLLKDELKWLRRTSPADDTRRTREIDSLKAPRRRHSLYHAYLRAAEVAKAKDRRYVVDWSLSLAGPALVLLLLGAAGRRINSV